MRYGQAPRQREKYGRGAGVALLPIPRRISAGERWGSGRPEAKEKEVGPFVVQGQKASDIEWRVYKALIRLGWDDSNVVFQTPILGGRRPGGQILDFVVYGNALVTVIAVNGDHWHKFGTKAEQTRINEAAVLRAMRSARYVALYSSDLQSDDQAYRVLLRHVGRGGG